MANTKIPHPSELESSRGKRSAVNSRLRISAKVRGEVTYQPQQPCPHGHLSPRRTSNGSCVECDRTRYLANRDKVIAAARRSVESRREAVASYQRGYRKREASRHKEYAHTRYLLIREVDQPRRIANRLKHRDRFNESSRALRRSNPEAARERDRASYAQNIEKRRQWAAIYRKENRDRLNADSRRFYWAHHDRRKAVGRRWRQKYPEKARALKALRRARKRRAATGDRKQYAVFVKWSRSAPSVSCYWCAKPTAPKRRHIDHIIPLSKGGADCVGNLCITCPACNLRKSAKLPFDFAGQGELHLA